MQRPKTIATLISVAEMTEEDKHEWCRQYAKLILDMYEKEHGPLPAPPSEEEFHRMWKKVMDTSS